MFRPLVIALFAVSAAPAFAGPGADLGAEAAALRDEAQTRANALAAAPAAPAGPVDESFVVRVEEFSAAAALLSHRIEDANGPQDLRCIFRGMSADAGARLDDFAEAETQADTARVYLEYVYLFNQAAEIAPEADADLPQVEPDVGFSCPARRNPLGED